MLHISLTDNNVGWLSGTSFNRKDVTSLFSIADTPIWKLCKENEHLIIFPDHIANTKDKLGELPILNIMNTPDPEKVRLITGNVLGFIGTRDIQLTIKSRFDQGESDYFLHYMLQKVLGYNIFDLSHTSIAEDIFDLVVFMFPYYLNTALRQGLYRNYQTIHCNDTHIRGRVNISRHISRNIPFSANIAYSTRAYSPDNVLTQLIRHTIEYIRTRRDGNVILRSNPETIDNVQVIERNTGSFDKSECRNIISRNLRMSIHPFYTAYYPLQLLCLQILGQEKIKFGASDSSIYGVLFDGAWLWEEYVNTLLNPLGFIHPENKSGKNGITLFDDGSGVRYPDFYNKEIVLDAKYKRLGGYDKVSKVDRDDLHQLITYMTVLGLHRGGFVAPVITSQSSVPTARIRNTGSSVAIYGIQVAEGVKDYADFCSKMGHYENKFLSYLKARKC